jgi:hypothetical protein
MASCVNLLLILTLMGFSLGKHKKTFGALGAEATRWFTEVNVTPNSTMFLVIERIGPVAHSAVERQTPKLSLERAVDQFSSKISIEVS